MDYRLKALAQWGLSVLPGGMALNDRLQRVRNGLPDSYHEGKIDHALELLELWRSATSNADQFPSEALEIGAGWDLLMALAVATSGCRSVRCLDVHPHLDAVRIGQSLERLRRRGISTPGDVQANLQPDRILSTLATNFGIHYAAPADARDTKLSEGSIDLIYTYHVFEHVPEPALLAIHKESFRLLKKGGIAVHWIDLQDHWAYSGTGRSLHGFLSDGPVRWNLLNPPIHYQNRLRAPDHLRIVREAGFENIEVVADLPTPEQWTDLQKPGAIHPTQVRGMSLEELGTTNLRLVLHKT